jgi:hypothetical protein
MRMSPRWGGTGLRWPRQEPHRPASYQHQGIEIVPLLSEPPVQAGAGQAAVVPGHESAECRTANDSLASLNRGQYRLIAGAQPVGMLDGDHPASREWPGVDDDAVSSGQDRLRRVPHKVHSPVPGTVRLGRWLKGPTHHRRRG